MKWLMKMKKISMRKKNSTDTDKLIHVNKITSKYNKVHSMQKKKNANNKS